MAQKKVEVERGKAIRKEELDVKGQRKRSVGREGFKRVEGGVEGEG